MVGKTRQHWDDFTNRRIDFNSMLDHFPDKERLLETIDNVAVLLKTQQSVEGSVLAGIITIWGMSAISTG